MSWHQISDFLRVVGDNSPILITAILGSSITTAFVNFRLRKSELERKEEKQVSFLAHEVAILLERYILSTSREIRKDEDAFYKGVQEGSLGNHSFTAIPSFPELPKVEGYHLLDKKLRNDIYEMFDVISIANDKSSAAFPHQEDMEFLDTLIAGKADVCLQAWQLAKSLRTECRLGDRSLTYNDFDRIAFLEGKSNQ